MSLLQTASYKLVLAMTVRARLIGLLSSRVCANGEVLVLAPCCSIHTIGMKGPIDVAFVDKKGRVLSVQHSLPPLRFSKDRQAVAVLERRAYSSEKWFEPGQQLMLASGQDGS